MLEDNARTPSGVSYMLENRDMMRLFPELFSRHRIAPVENYPDELLATLKSGGAFRGLARSQCRAAHARRVQFYQHSFLADKLGVEWSEGRDLVKDEIVYMRTTQGPQRVDRRIDDDFIDPLTFRPDSALGVACYTAGNVTLANAVGTGIADDKAIYSFMPAIVKFYLGEEPLLKTVPTWRCREEEHLAYVLDHLQELVVKEVHGSGGYGMLMGLAAEQDRHRAVPRQAENIAEGSPSRPSRHWRSPPARPASSKAWRCGTSTCGPSCSGGRDGVRIDAED